MKWISEKASAPDFISSASTFSFNTTRTFKLDRRLSLDRAPEPNVDTAWTYVNGKVTYMQASV